MQSEISRFWIFYLFLFRSEIWYAHHSMNKCYTKNRDIHIDDVINASIILKSFNA